MPLPEKSFLLRAVLVPFVAIAVLVWAFLSNGAYSRLVAVIALFVLAADLASLLRGVAQNVLVAVATLLLGVAAIETVAMARAPRVELLHPPGLWGGRPELGWGPRAPGRFAVEKRVDGKTIYKVTYTIDQDLLRQTTSTGQAEGAAKGPRVAFFGDSITFGEGLDDADTLPQSFADLAPGVDVVNLAFSAYSPSQVLRELQVGLYDKRIEGARAFVLLTGPWHAERTACKPDFSVRAPRFAMVAGKLEYEGPCFSGLGQRVQEFYKGMATYDVVLAPLLQRPTHADLETYLQIVGEVARLAREKYGAPLVVLYVTPPDHYLDGTGFTDAIMLDRLRASGIHVVDATLDGTEQELTIPGDGHPNAVANRRQAKKLVDDFKATLPKVLAPPGRAASP